jgi:uncharacterized protein YbbC (DUF1343 family)
VLGELGVISEGVGYTIPFRTFAAEWIDPLVLAEKMNALHVEGIIFRPITFKPFYGRFTGKQLRGVQLHLTDPSRVNLLAVQFLFMQVHHELYPDHNPFLLADESRRSMFDKVMGSDQVRILFSRRMLYGDVKDFLDQGVEAFRAKAKKYFIY